MSHDEEDFDSVYGGKYLSAGSLNGEIRRMKIAAVDPQTLREKDGTERRKYVLHFEGEERTLPLNKTNALRCATSFGKDRASWVGRTVELYTEMTGIGKEGIRLRPVQQQKPQIPVSNPDPCDELPY